MPKYKAIKKDNGKYVIEHVPIFKLGNSRGYDYTVGWAKTMLSVMDKRAKSGYYAPIIIGHSCDGWITGEKPVHGFMTNYSLSGGGDDPAGMSGTIYCDFDDVPESTMREISELRYPYRSIEVRPNVNEITAVALLGASEPYFKFPRLEVSGFSADGESYSVQYEDRPDDNGQSKQSFVKEIVDGIRDLFKRDSADADNNTNDPVEDEMDREKFKAQYGFYPEEIEAIKAEADQAKKFKARVEQLEADLGKIKSADFEKYCQEQGVTPAAISRFQALIDGSADPDKAREEFKAMVKDGFKAPLGETAQHADKPVAVDGTDAEALHVAVTAYAAEHKLSYQEALGKVLSELDSKKGGAE